MASIIKRKSKYSVVYRYVDENGVERQKWETFDTNAEAKKGWFLYVILPPTGGTGL